MHNTVFTTFMTFSDDGRSFLIKEKQFGPEGGGSFLFILINTKEKTYSEYELSSDFGNGSTPPKISQRECRKNVKRLGIDLKKYGFSGSDVRKDCCASKEWDKCISLSQSALDINKKAFFGTEGDVLVHSPFSIKIKDDKMGLFRNSDQLLLWSLHHPQDNETSLNSASMKQVQAWMSPGEYQIVMFSFVRFNNHLLTDILFSHDGSGYTRISLDDMSRI